MFFEYCDRIIVAPLLGVVAVATRGQSITAAVDTLLGVYPGRYKPGQLQMNCEYVLDS